MYCVKVEKTDLRYTLLIVFRLKRSKFDVREWRISKQLITKRTHRAITALEFPTSFCFHALPFPGYAEPRYKNITDTKLIFLSLVLINPKSDDVRYEIV